mmetsp:Transcript_60781/g.144806  ORF Transcript_60781/g.144806 Transcript_60781/m.144806 type:complete len:150 (-) Transcript_60781:289-738(-)
MADPAALAAATAMVARSASKLGAAETSGVSEEGTGTNGSGENPPTTPSNDTQGGTSEPLSDDALGGVLGTASAKLSNVSFRNTIEVLEVDDGDGRDATDMTAVRSRASGASVRSGASSSSAAKVGKKKSVSKRLSGAFDKVLTYLADKM